MKKIIEFLMRPWTKYKERQAYKKRLEQLRKADPFIYK
jgi:hypothetical protein